MYNRSPFHSKLSPTSQFGQTRYENFTKDNSSLDEITRRIYGIDRTMNTKKKYKGNTDHMKLQWNNQLTDHN